MEPKSKINETVPCPFTDESHSFANLIGEPEFQLRHDWVINPVIHELEARLLETRNPNEKE